MDKVNKSELVQAAVRQGFRVHRGLPRKELLRPSKKSVNPVDAYRDKIMKFFEANWSKVKDQIEVGCEADCYAHHDVQVLLCWLKNRKVIERSLKKMPKKKVSLRDELEALSPFHLKKRAKAEGLKPKEIKEAGEGEALIDLIIEKVEGGGGKKSKKSSPKKQAVKKGKKKEEETEEDPEEEDPEEDPDDDGDEDPDDDPDDDDDDDEGEDPDDDDPDPDPDDDDDDEEDEKPKRRGKKAGGRSKVKSSTEDDLSAVIDGIAAMRKEMAEIKELFHLIAGNSVIVRELVKKGFARVFKATGAKGWAKIVAKVEEEVDSEGE